jgi:hypothetical protein
LPSVYTCLLAVQAFGYPCGLPFGERVELLLAVSVFASNLIIRLGSVSVSVIISLYLSMMSASFALLAASSNRLCSLMLVDRSGECLRDAVFFEYASQPAAAKLGDLPLALC